MRDVVSQVQRRERDDERDRRSRESAGIDQIGDAVQSLDQMTQQNAALVESAAAASLKQQAAELTRLVSAFKVDE